MNAQDRLQRLSAEIAKAPLFPVTGYLTEVRVHILKGILLNAPLGAICAVSCIDGSTLKAEVIGIENGVVALCPFGSTEGIVQGARVTLLEDILSLNLSAALTGRAVDVFLKPIDNAGDIKGPFQSLPIRQPATSPMVRPLISQPFTTGVRAIDGLATLGVGQRIGVFGPPGTGKTSLLATLVKHCKADMIVVGLVGERGREVREFVEDVLPANMRDKVVVVAATSERPAMERAICALTATTVAEYFRDTGKNVFLLIDSLTRTARALREIGLAAGEAPTRRGYPASVYPALPTIIERAGRAQKGSITAMYTVLTEGQIDSDPIAEEVKSLTDGHLVLSRELAAKAHYPALDMRVSLSRSMTRVAQPDHAAAAGKMRRLLSKYDEIEMLLQVGEYEEGNDAETDAAVKKNPLINEFLVQSADRGTEFEKTVNLLKRICI